MLRVENLSVSVQGRLVLSDVNLHVKSGQTVVLFGQNGSGKTTLLMTLMGFRNYKVQTGRIYYGDQDITHLPAHERAKMGIGMLFQRPPTIKGLRVRELVRVCGDQNTPVEDLARELNFLPFLDRSVNEGFSGGEIKRSELLQLMAQGPEMLLLDEPDSGVDLENIALVGKAINHILEREIRHYDFGPSLKLRREGRHHSGLLITHSGYILDYVTADRGVVMMNGKLVCEGNPYEIFHCIRDLGYEECVRCNATGTHSLRP